MIAHDQPDREPDPAEGPAVTVHRAKILFVCARNKIRSLTAEKMFSGSHLYDVKSRGVGRQARIRLTERDVRWADAIFVMEKNHQNRILKEYRAAAVGKEIVCLFIDDIYQPMEAALISELREKLLPHLVVPGM